MKKKPFNFIIGNMVLFLVLLLLSLNSIAQEGRTEMDKMWGEDTVTSDAALTDKAQFFDESNFGMFIHWGLFSHLGGKWKDKTYYGIGEWIMNPAMAGIPVDEYKNIANEFNPVDFNAKALAKLAKDAGMKYIIITSKHHEGFAMFDSDADLFNIVDATPFARDPMKELSQACHELGLGFGFYYSHNQDWTCPGATGGPKQNADGTPATFKNYFYTKCKPQVKEICTNYGDIDFVWFDTPGNMPKEFVIELADLVRELQPGAMLCSRIGYGMGDYASKGDMEVPPRNIEGLWESCDTNNDSWSFAWYDNNFKNTKEILHRLISTVARGGSYLFNVGPDAKGNIPVIGQKFLRETGTWISKYPQVIYDAGSSPWGHELAWGDVTNNGSSLFLSVMEWPQDGKLYLPGLRSTIKSAKLLNSNKPQEIKLEQKQGWTIFDIGCSPLDHPVSVIELELYVAATETDVDVTHGIYPNIETTLLAEFADVENAEKKKISWMEKFGEWRHMNQIGKWTADSKATWMVDVCEPGYYYLELRYKGKDRLVWKTETDEGILVQNQQAATEKYQQYNMGILEFKTAGKHTITVSLVEGNSETTSLSALIIKPVK